MNPVFSLRDAYQVWWKKNQIEKLMMDYLEIRTPLPEEKMNPAFEPAIEIPPEIEILCFYHERWWKCRIKSETLECDIGFVPFGLAIQINCTLEDTGKFAEFQHKANAIAFWLFDRKWPVESIHYIVDLRSRGKREVDRLAEEIQKVINQRGK